MHRRSRLAITTVLAAGAVVLAGATGCGTATSTAKPKATVQTSAAIDPMKVLPETIHILGTTPYHYTMSLSDKDGTETVSGALDSASSTGSLTMKFEDISIELLRRGTDRWAKVAVPDVPNKWFHVSVDKMPKPYNRQLGELSFATDAVGVLRSIVTVNRTASGGYEGTFDLTKDHFTGLADDKMITDLGDKAKTVPFTAVLDEKQRLTKLHIDIPVTVDDPKGSTLDLMISDYGVAPTVTAPAGAAEATSDVYAIFADS